MAKLLKPTVKWNGKTIALDDGHGMETAGKRTPYVKKYGRFIKENEFNRAVVNFLADELLANGFRVLLVAPTDADTSLAQRVKDANAHKVNAYISIHYNALDGKFDGNDPSGIEIHHYPPAQDSRRLAESIGKYMKQGTKQKWRGVKATNYYVLRETTMTAVLSENGFMDNEQEAELMLNVSFQKETATEHAKGICDYFGVKYQGSVQKPVTTQNKASDNVSKSEQTFYRVVTGSFGDYDNAERRKGALKKAGFDSFIDVVKKDGEVFYRVVTGSFTELDNAEAQKSKIAKKNFASFIDVYVK